MMPQMIPMMARPQNLEVPDKRRTAGHADLFCKAAGAGGASGRFSSFESS